MICARTRPVQHVKILRATVSKLFGSETILRTSARNGENGLVHSRNLDENYIQHVCVGRGTA
jgi:hypothetical protein